MRRSVLACLLFAVSTPALASRARAERANPAVSGSVSSSPADKEVLAALETWRHAMVKKDAAAFDKVFHPDLSYGHSIGLVETKQQATDHVMKSTTVYDDVTFADTKVSVRGDTAVVTGKVKYLKHPKDKAVIVQNLVVLSVWVKTGKGWQMLARQSTEVQPAPVAKK